jgi:hypothetical protein
MATKATAINIQTQFADNHSIMRPFYLLHAPTRGDATTFNATIDAYCAY